MRATGSTVWFVMRLVQLAAGFVLLALGWQIGKTRVALISSGAHAQGRIVGYEQQRFSMRSLDNLGRMNSAMLAVVEFRPKNETIRFTDWVGRGSNGSVGEVVPVLYSPAQPSQAVIDRPVANWMPWAPFCAVGLLLVLSGLRGLYSMRNA